MNYATLKRISDLEGEVEELKKQLVAYAADVARLVTLVEQLQERRTLTLPKKDAGYRQASSGD